MVGLKVSSQLVAMWWSVSTVCGDGWAEVAGQPPPQGGCGMIVG